MNKKCLPEVVSTVNVWAGAFKRLLPSSRVEKPQHHALSPEENMRKFKILGKLSQTSLLFCFQPNDIS